MNRSAEEPGNVEPVLACAEKLAAYNPSEYDALPKNLQNQAAQELWRAARALPKRSTRNPLSSPWSAEDTTHVYEYLSLARKLLVRAAADVPLAMRKELALAAWFKEDAIEWKLHAVDWKLLEGYEPPGGLDEVLYMLVKAKAEATSPKGHRTAFELYVRVWGMIEDNFTVPVAERYEKVLRPAIESGESVVLGSGLEADTGFKKRLADCYRAKGKLINDNPNLWPDWRREGVSAYGKAARYDPQPKGRLELSKARQSMALALTTGGAAQRDNLIKALVDADQALAELSNETLVHMAHLVGVGAGSAIDLVVSLGSPLEGKHPPLLAILYLQKGKLLVNMGRNFGKKDAVVEARAALSNALAWPGLNPEEQAEAHLNLGAAFLFSKNSDYPKAARHLRAYLQFAKEKSPGLDNIVGRLQFAEEKGPVPDKQSAAFQMMAAVGDALWLEKKYADAADWYADIRRHAVRAKDEEHEFFGANRLFWLGRVYEGRKDPNEALRVYELGLPGDMRQVTPAQLRLLTARTELFLNPVFEETLKVKRDLKALLGDAKRGVELATTNHPWVEDALKAEAYAIAAVCYLRDRQKDKGYQHFGKAIELAPQEWKKFYRDQLKKWKDTGP